MKKIIAMLLCVAMVAALGVSAFAAEATPKTSKTVIWDVKDWYDYLTGEGKAEAKTGIALYASELGAAKAAAQKKLDAYNAQIKTAAQAVQAAQYATVAAYVDAATTLYKAAATNAVNQALAEFKIALENEMKVATAADVIGDFGLK